MKAKISKVVVTSHIARSDNSVRHSYEVHYESGVIREFFDCNVSKNVVSFLDKATLIDSSFVPDFGYNRLIESYRITESHRYWFSCESMEDSPCNDCTGTLEDAVKVAQECANEINEPVYVNDTLDNDNIVDVAYPNSYFDTEENVEEQPENVPEHETPETTTTSEVKECEYCRECIHYGKCSVYAPEKMECRTGNRLLCGSVVCCEDFVSRKSIDDIYEEQKRTESYAEDSTSSAEIPNDNAFREICVNCRSCIHFRKCLDLDRVYFCRLESGSPYHIFTCETDSNIECRGKYLDCHQNECEYLDYPESFEVPDDELPF